MLLSDRPLEYTFEVKYDVSERIMSLIRQLNAMDFELRNATERELVGMGAQFCKHCDRNAQPPGFPGPGLARVIRQIEQPLETKDD